MLFGPAAPTANRGMGVELLRLGGQCLSHYLADCTQGKLEAKVLSAFYADLPGQQDAQ